MVRKREQGVGSSEEKKIKARALVELLTYIENCVEDGTFYFKFSALHQLFEERVQYLGVEKETIRTRFKEKVLAYFLQAQEQSDGKNKLFSFKTASTSCPSFGADTLDSLGTATFAIFNAMSRMCIGIHRA